MSQGFETCKALFVSPTPYHILLGVRSSASRAEEPIANLKAGAPNSKSSAEGLAIDVDSDESIENAFKEVSYKYDHIDVLINNAGADYGALAAKGEISTREAWLKGWNTNVAGTHIMTQTFIPLLLKSKNTTPRLIFITSGQASLTKMAEQRSPFWKAPPAGWPKTTSMTPLLSYRASKVGMNMMYLDWVRVLQNDPVKVFCVSPGYLATGLSFVGAEAMAKAGAMDPSVGGNTIKNVVEGMMDENAGMVINGRKGEDPVTAIQAW
jgi:NAD(P)-dependent dehydrogenase (short-subunit alcohol dehydrogenase family)